MATNGTIRFYLDLYYVNEWHGADCPFCSTARRQISRLALHCHLRSFHNV